MLLTLALGFVAVLIGRICYSVGRYFYMSKKIYPIAFTKTRLPIIKMAGGRKDMFDEFFPELFDENGAPYTAAHIVCLFASQLMCLGTWLSWRAKSMVL